MTVEFSEAQAASQAEFRDLVTSEIAPHADRWDRDEQMPRDLIARLGQRGYLGGLIPLEYGGAGMDMLTFGLLNEEVGRGCSSVRSLLTVHGMVQFAIGRWGSDDLKKKWLPRLATGEVIGAFGLTEPGAGSDAAAIETSAVVNENSYILNGTKVWTTFGQIADLVPIFGKLDGRNCAFLVESASPGFLATPVSGSWERGPR